MKIILESTTQIVTINGLPCRLWEGKTDKGVVMHAYIARVAVADGQSPEAYRDFERDLKECKVPTVELAARCFPLRLLVDD